MSNVKKTKVELANEQNSTTATTNTIAKSTNSLWKQICDQTMVLNLPNGCVIAFDGGHMQFVPNVRWVDGKFQ